MNLFDLRGRVGLVTGSSRGIGFALARGLLQAGARVVIHGRDVKQATISATRLAEATGGQTRVSTFDVTDLAAVDRGIAAIEHDWGTPDILVNNAGVQRRKTFVEFDLEDWNDLVATNLTSAFLVSQRIARGMVARGSGKIINIGSVQSQLARPGIAPYSATKGGIGMLTKGLCADLAPSGVQANALAPGYFDTELTRALVEDDEFSAVIAGGLAGVLGAILIAAFDGSWVPLGIYTFILAAITLGTTFIAPESQGRDLLRVEDALDDVRAEVLVSR